jgi:eukaryotic-like serine/threonine-protein kinase
MIDENPRRIAPNPLVLNQMADRLATSLGARYRVERELGVGGMATVYLATDLKHDRNVAIKVLKPELAAVLGAERFVVEIKTTAALQHPHILPLFDSGEADGQLFYVMPYIEGETIRDKLNRETQFGVDEAVRIAREVADALDYAHRHGVIHRDIKPENILLHDGRAMVMDFGIALAVSAAAGGRMTETGLSLGTPHYMSPEQATAEKEITPRSDIYSLASVLYEMLTGEPPHTAGSAQGVIMKIITDVPRPAEELRKNVPSNVSAALSKALEKLPADRFENAKAFGDALANPTFTISSASAGGRTRVMPRGVPPWLFIAVSGVAAASLIAAAWAFRRPPSVLPAPSARFALELPDSQTIASVAASSIAIAPDGSEIVYTGASSTVGRVLYRRRLDDLTVREVPGTSGVLGNIFSPNGELAFVKADRALTLLPRDGRPVTKIVDDAGRVSWGDGDVIAFIRGSSLWRTNSSGNPVTRLTTVDSAAGEGDTWPFVLPGGKAILFNKYREARMTSELDAFVVRVADGKVTRLGIKGSNPRYVSSGHVLVAQSDGSILAAPFDLNTLEVRGAPVRVLEGVFVRPNGAALYDVSRNGVLAYVAAGETQRAVIVDRDGHEQDVGFGDGMYAHPRVSPNGERVAIERSEGAGNDIWVATLATRQVVRLTRDGRSSSPEWSADGTRVGWIHADSTGATIRWQRADGSGTAETIPTPKRALFRFTFTPEGKSVVAVVGGPFRHDIVLFSIDGSSAPRTLVNSDADELQPSISPDGRWMLYTSNETGRSEVFVVSVVDPSTRLQITTDGGAEPAWRGDGHSLVERSGSAFVSISLRFTSGVEVTRRDSMFTYKYLRGSPDRGFDVDRQTGGLVALARTGSTHDRIIVVTGWLDELKTRANPSAKP